MKTSLFVLAALLLFQTTACTQDKKSTTAYDPSKKVGGGCEGCEAVFESPIPLDKLNWIDTLPDYNEPGPKLVISGVVYRPDGKTPAPGVVLYVYHTDQAGKYSKKGNEKGWGLRHGYIRGWMRTNEKGQYKFYTLRPASYPGSNIPAHIHPTIKEADKNEYWIDEYVFDDDKFLTASERKNHEGRGGNGILKLKEKNGVFYGERNIVLGLKVPNYPLK